MAEVALNRAKRKWSESCQLSSAKLQAVSVLGSVAIEVAERQQSARSQRAAWFEDGGSQY
jgi:hypothetical protein